MPRAFFPVEVSLFGILAGSFMRVDEPLEGLLRRGGSAFLAHPLPVRPGALARGEPGPFRLAPRRIRGKGGPVGHPPPPLAHMGQRFPRPSSTRANAAPEDGY